MVTPDTINPQWSSLHRLIPSHFPPIELFLSATQEPDTEVTMREYINQVALPLHDARSENFERLHDKDDYQTSQAFAKQFRAQGSNGLLFRSVRHEKGECIAAFKPKAVSIPTQGQHFRYVYDGQKQKITAVLMVSQVHLD
ncbi:MAG: RES family NAD+ phosphorylase [Psychrosphaera sp.]|nr:RES family NAD+ phosphorylase [Psychrosphaera sp.]